MSDEHQTAGSRGRRLRAVLAVALAVAALLVYVFAMGAIENLVRFAAVRLPSAKLVGDLPAGILVGYGLRTLALTVAGFAVLTVVAHVSAGRNWDANRHDWGLVVKHGVRGGHQLRMDPADATGAHARAAQAAQASSARRAKTAERVATLAHGLRLGGVARRAGDRAKRARDMAQAKDSAAATQAASASRRAAWAGMLGRTSRAQSLSQQADRAQAASHAQPKGVPDPNPPSNLTALRIVAGFNVTVISGVVGLALARVVERYVPHWWAFVPAGLVVFLAFHWALTSWGPLRWGPRVQAGAWVLVGAAALLTSAPIGMLILTAVVISTYGRRLVRGSKLGSPASFVRSPLPWALLALYSLVWVTYYAVPPVFFPRVVITTASGQVIGGYVAHASSGFALVTCTPLADATSTGEHAVYVPDGPFEQIRLGGGSDALDSGRRPSLAALALGGLLGVEPPTLIKVDLHARHPTCAGADPPHLTIGREDPALGTGVIVGRGPPGGRAHDGEAPISLTTPGPVAQLALRYQPTVEVTVADPFWPVSVGAVLQDRGPRGDTTCVIPLSQPPCSSVPVLTGRGDPATYLRYPTTSAPDVSALTHTPAAQIDAFERGQHMNRGPLHHWLADPGILDPWATAQVYFFYAGPVHFNGVPSAGPARAKTLPAWPVDPNLSRPLIGLQYWFFYPYNYLPVVVGAQLMDGAPLAGDVANADLHQGDWEHVTVLLDAKTLAPEWLYMAHHDNEGRFYRWTSPSLSFDGTHPIVQAAFGGHPTYDNNCGPRPRYQHSINGFLSDWVVCGSGRFGFRASTTPLVDLARTSWGCWQGHFGEANPRFEPKNDSRQSDVLTSVSEQVYVRGPRSPLWQAENGRLHVDDQRYNDIGVCKNGRPEVAEAQAAAGGLGGKPTGHG